MKTLAPARRLRAGERAIAALGLVTVPAADLGAARKFYTHVLGLEDAGTDLLPGFGAHAVLRFPSRELLVLAAPQGPDTRDSGVHHGYRVGATARAAIAKRLAATDVPVLTYKEDRSAEEADNFYFHDADGNRIQLVTADSARTENGAEAIDHTAVLAYDMLWAEAYYVHDLKFAVESRFGLRTADHSRAQSWARGEADMAPGTRRVDKLYMRMGGQNEVARCNMQIYLAAGESVFGVYLATRHQQEPPEEQIVGAPRTTFWTAREDLDRIAAILERRGRPFEGPVLHPPSAPFAASLYCKDPSGNFLEFAAPRG